MATFVAAIGCARAAGKALAALIGSVVVAAVIIWTLTIPVRLEAGHNTVRFASEELPDFDGTTFISDRYTEPLRSRYAPIIDRIGVTPYAR
jgi:hypothetical protein